MYEKVGGGGINSFNGFIFSVAIFFFFYFNFFNDGVGWGELCIFINQTNFFLFFSLSLKVGGGGIIPLFS